MEIRVLSLEEPHFKNLFYFLVIRLCSGGGERVIFKYFPKHSKNIIVHSLASFRQFGNSQFVEYSSCWEQIWHLWLTVKTSCRDLKELDVCLLRVRKNTRWTDLFSQIYLLRVFRWTNKKGSWEGSWCKNRQLEKWACFDQWDRLRNQGPLDFNKPRHWEIVVCIVLKIERGKVSWCKNRQLEKWACFKEWDELRKQGSTRLRLSASLRDCCMYSIENRAWESFLV